MKKPTHAQYTEEQRIAAVAILLANSNTDKGMTLHSIQLARDYLQANVSLSTFSAWVKQYKDKVLNATLEPETDKVTAEIVFTANNNVVETMEGIRDHLLALVDKELRENPENVAKQGLQRLITSAAILQDKIKDATASSAAMQAAMRPLALLCSELGIDIYQLIEDNIHILRGMSKEDIDRYKTQGRLGDGTS